MAALPAEDRQRIWRGLMRYWSQAEEALGSLDKGDLQDAVDATDTFIDGNAGAYNAALPLAARTELTADQKTLLFSAVALMRQDVNLLRRILGEVD